MRAEVEELQAARTQLKKDLKTKQRQLDDEKRENDKVRAAPALGRTRAGTEMVCDTRHLFSETPIRTIKYTVVYYFTLSYPPISSQFFGS